MKKKYVVSRRRGVKSRVLFLDDEMNVFIQAKEKYFKLKGMFALCWVLINGKNTTEEVFSVLKKWDRKINKGKDLEKVLEQLTLMKLIEYK